MTTTYADVLPEVRLQFNINNPSIDETWTEGYDLAIAEGDESDNPYQEGTKAFAYWNEGWWAGFYAEKPLFDLAATPDNEIRREMLSSQAKPAANDVAWNASVTKKWAVRVVKISSVIALALAAVELVDLAA